jgi:hypothetical protein
MTWEELTRIAPDQIEKDEAYLDLIRNRLRDIWFAKSKRDFPATDELKRSVEALHPEFRVSVHPDRVTLWAVITPPLKPPLHMANGPWFVATYHRKNEDAPWASWNLV